MTLMQRNFCCLLAIAALFPALGQSATTRPTSAPTSMLAAMPGDQIPDRLLGGESVRIDVDHAPVQVSWALPGADKLAPRPQPFQRLSRNFQIDASGTELERGVSVPLSAPGAMLHISPRDSASAPLSAAQVYLTVQGQRHSAGRFAGSMASGSSMAQAGMSVQPGSIAMRLDDSVGAGTIRVDAQGARGHYLIQVREPQSPFALVLVADRDTRLAGQAVEFRAHLRQPADTARVDAVSGVLEAPDGWSTNIDFAPMPDQSYVARIRPAAAHAGQRGLWQVHVFASGHAGRQVLLRDASNAFAAVRPTARFNGHLRRQANRPGGDLAIEVGIEAAAASRYAIAGVLYGHDGHGALKPAVYAQSADWLTPGNDRHIILLFDADAVARSGLQAPFELHDLRLDDQVQLGLLERRQVAARGIPAND